MTGQDDNDYLSRMLIDPALQRRRLATLAATIAHTEDRVADTLERLALTRPYDATALRARAAHARQKAAQERNRAAAFSHPREPRRTGAVTQSPRAAE
jgi:hypothetical protein